MVLAGFHDLNSNTEQGREIRVPAPGPSPNFYGQSPVQMIVLFFLQEIIWTRGGPKNSKNALKPVPVRRCNFPVEGTPTIRSCLGAIALLQHAPKQMSTFKWGFMSNCGESSPQVCGKKKQSMQAARSELTTPSIGWWRVGGWICGGGGLDLRVPKGGRQNEFDHIFFIFGHFSVPLSDASVIFVTLLPDSFGQTPFAVG